MTGTYPVTAELLIARLTETTFASAFWATAVVVVAATTEVAEEEPADPMHWGLVAEVAVVAPHM